MLQKIVFLFLLAFTFIGCGQNFQPLQTVHAAPPPQAPVAPEPVVVHKSFVNQVGPIPITSILTAPADGDYLVSIEITAPPTSTAVPQAVGLYPIWTDENGPVNPDFPPFAISGSINGPGTEPMRLQMTVSVRAKAGTDIKVSGLQGGDSINHYSAFVTIQSLQ